MLNILKEVRKRNPYPKDIFTEPTKEEYIKLQRSTEEAGLVQDKFFGWFGRGVWNNCIDEIKKVIEEELETPRCPFRQIIDDEPTGYCMIDDCMFDPEDEQKCGIFITHLKILALKDAQGRVSK